MGAGHGIQRGPIHRKKARYRHHRSFHSSNLGSKNMAKIEVDSRAFVAETHVKPDHKVS